jgi:hypothetical protein
VVEGVLLGEQIECLLFLEHDLPSNLNLVLGHFEVSDDVVTAEFVLLACLVQLRLQERTLFISSDFFALRGEYVEVALFELLNDSFALCLQVQKTVEVSCCNYIEVGSEGLLYEGQMLEHLGIVLFGRFVAGQMDVEEQ